MVKSIIRLTTGVIQAPIFTVLTRKIRALHVTPHGNENIDVGECIDQLGVLRSFHIDEKTFFHDSNRILIDFIFRYRTCRIGVDHIRIIGLAKALAICERQELWTQTNATLIFGIETPFSLS